VLPEPAKDRVRTGGGRPPEFCTKVCDGQRAIGGKNREKGGGEARKSVKRGMEHASEPESQRA
jgi:hypothetical protein